MRRQLALMATGAAFGCTLACSLALDFLQCRDTADCMNTANAELVCRDNECVVPPDPGTVECASSAECVAEIGEDHVCVPAGNCAALTSAVCTQLVTPAETSLENVLWIGAIQATSAPFDSVGIPLQNAVRLAVADFNSVASVAGKKIGVVLCNSRGSAANAGAAADHLIAAGVQVIVGPTFSEEVFEVADSTVGAGVFTISPTATNKGITTLDDDGLVWRNISSDIHQAAALVDLVSELDPGPSKVVLFIKNDAYGNGILEDITDPLAVRLPAGGLVTLKYSDPSSFDSNEELLNEYGARIATAIMAEPDTIVVVGTSEARELILFYLDVWSGIEPLPTLPRFIVTHGGVPVMEAVVEAVAESFRPTLMANVQGVAPIIADEDNFEAYNIRYKIRFDGEDAITVSSLSYDATLVALLALSASGANATGADVAATVQRLVDPTGTVISFGGAGLKFISDAVNALESGANLDLKGVSGALDFNVETGEVRTDLINWGLVPRSSDPTDPVLTPVQLYTLDAPPAAGGSWSGFD